jgi:hypothetical protein
MGDHRPRRANLSVADVLRLQPDVDRVIAMGLNPHMKWSAKTVKRFVAAIVPMFKRALVNGHVDTQGRPIVRIHCDEWQRAAGKHTDYVKLREALSWFVPTMEKPLATMWAFRPTLTEDVPRQELGHRWEIAMVAARKQQRRTTQRMEVGNG